MSAQIKNAAHANDRVLIIERAFAAPRDLVFKMWTVREHVSLWLAPRGFTITQSDADVRPGGAWRSCMRSPEGVDHCVGGVYRDVVENERLVFTHAWDGDKGKPGHETVVTLTLEDYGGDTKVRLRQEVFDSVETRDGHRDGWTESLDKLGKHLAAL